MSGYSGGNGASITTADAYVKTGDINPLPATAGWQLIPTANIPELVIPGVVGKRCEVSWSAMRNASASAFIDVANVTGAGPTVQRYMSSGNSTPCIEGAPSFYISDTFINHSSSMGFVITAADLDNGNIRFRVAYSSIGAGILYCSNNYPFYWNAKVF